MGKVTSTNLSLYILSLAAGRYIDIVCTAQCKKLCSMQIPTSKQVWI